MSQPSQSRRRRPSQRPPSRLAQPQTRASAPPSATAKSIVIDRRFGLALTAIAGLAALSALGFRLASSGLSLPSQAGIAIADPDASLWLVFLTGLSIGGLSCVAVQGGLLATSIAARAVERHAGAVTIRAQLLPVTLFLGAKLLAYTLLGAILGLVGSKIPIGLQAWLMIAVGLFMLMVVAQMYDLHPLFRLIAFRPPKALQRLLRARSKQGSASSPLLLGALTVFIPCGVTLAMEALAIASNSALRGALIMAVFTLGSAPLFFVLGFAASRLSGLAFRSFRPLAALAIVAIAGLSIHAGARLLGYGGMRLGGETVTATQLGDPVSAAAIQSAEIQVRTASYSPSRVRIKAGIPTRLSLVSEQAQGCVRAFLIPGLGIERMLPVDGTELIELPPAEPGTVIPFTCSMGMYGGNIEVVQ